MHQTFNFFQTQYTFTLLVCLFNETKKNLEMKKNRKTISKKAIKNKERRLNENSNERSARLQKNRERNKNARAKESITQRQHRQNADKMRKRMVRKRKKLTTDKDSSLSKRKIKKICVSNVSRNMIITFNHYRHK